MDRLTEVRILYIVKIGRHRSGLHESQIGTPRSGLRESQIGRHRSFLHESDK